MPTCPKSPAACGGVLYSVATTLLEQRMPLEQIQQFLGHAQLDTTQIYATATSAMIKKSYQQALSREPGVLTQGC